MLGLLKKDNSDPLTPEQAAELKALAALPEDQINTRDLPEQQDWSAARPFFPPDQKATDLAP
jgi:hypothetical protein